MRTRIIVQLTAALLAATACSSSPAQDGAASGERTGLTVAVAAPGLPFIQLYVAQEKGLFTKHGLDVQLVNVEGSAASTAALQSGSADLTVSLPEGVITARAAGAAIKMIGSTADENLYKMYVSKDVTSLDQLAGKKIAMLTEGNGTDIQARLLLDKKGAGANRSNYVATGALPNRLAAVQNGQAAGTLLFPPFDVIADRAGVKSLYSLKDLQPGYPNEVVAASEQSIAGKADALRAFMSAIVEASTYVRADLDESAKIATKVIRSPEDVLRASLEQMTNALTKDGSISGEGLRAVIDSMNQYGTVKNLPSPEELYDNRFVSSS